MKEPADKNEKPQRKCDICGVALRWQTRCNLCNWLMDDDEDESPLFPW
jgi:hypothetical protein